MSDECSLRSAFTIILHCPGPGVAESRDLNLAVLGNFGHPEFRNFE